MNGKKDAEFSVLDDMTAPIGWWPSVDNLQYYGSTVDNKNYGFQASKNASTSYWAELES